MIKDIMAEYPVIFITFIILIVAFIAGWIMNIVAITGLSSVTIMTGMGILRIIGIFIPPLGAILGYM